MGLFDEFLKGKVGCFVGSFVGQVGVVVGFSVRLVGEAVEKHLKWLDIFSVIW